MIDLFKRLSPFQNTSNNMSWVQIPPEATHFSFFHLPQVPVFLSFHLKSSCKCHQITCSCTSKNMYIYIKYYVHVHVHVQQLTCTFASNTTCMYMCIN